MSRYELKPTLVLVAALLLAGCTADTDQAAVVAAPATAPAAESAALDEGAHCFRNATTGDGVTDIAELLFTVTEDRAAGEYNWLPQEKDQRRGTFSGPVAGNRIAANYQFSQEGQTATAELAITVDETQATIEGGAPELGLGATLEKVEC
ncbi:hypothetical protein DFR52_1011208 [Hoeflea marina]|uniref:Lipoprotein n=1 Tax=Hoeflea marina TaxID=274592 RepID=A0A317PTP8_9HYPH|nr:hypothetical protein [Hoeflea marina]PWW04509.1 hypothetical protein DFR52_1011208 [Hoeflea marina]